MPWCFFGSKSDVFFGSKSDVFYAKWFSAWCFFGSKSDAICHLGTLQIAIPLAEEREAEVVLVAWGAERHYQGLYIVAPWAVVHLGNMYVGVN